MVELNSIETVFQNISAGGSEYIGIRLGFACVFVQLRIKEFAFGLDRSKVFISPHDNLNTDGQL